MNVYCIKEIDGLKFGKMYYISGTGDLQFIHTIPKRSGIGFGITDPSVSNSKDYYYNEIEMNKHFITSEEYYQGGMITYIRNLKLEEILK